MQWAGDVLVLHSMYFLFDTDCSWLDVWAQLKRLACSVCGWLLMPRSAQV